MAGIVLTPIVCIMLVAIILIAFSSLISPFRLMITSVRMSSLLQGRFLPLRDIFWLLVIVCSLVFRSLMVRELLPLLLIVLVVQNLLWRPMMLHAMLLRSLVMAAGVLRIVWLPGMVRDLFFWSRAARLDGVVEGGYWSRFDVSSLASIAQPVRKYF